MTDRSSETPATAVRRPVRVADWNVNPATGQLERDGRVVKLEPKTMDVLIYLANRQGEVVTREELEAALWAPAIVGYDAVSTTILKLRKAFDDDPKNPQIIETIPKRGYRLVAPVQPVAEPSVHNGAMARPYRPRNRLTRLVLAVLAFAAIGILVWSGSWRGDIRSDSKEVASIAVLPFANLDSGSDQAYFADGISDDLITDLTKISGLFVISRDSSFAYKGEPVDLPKVAERLGVRYLLHGSVRRSGESIRINAQLTDARSGRQLWAERYDGEAKNIFTLQDQITQQIVSSLAVKLTAAERRHLARKDTHNVAAYENFLRGEERFFHYAKKSNREARALFDKAIDLDPSFSRAYAMLGWTHVFDFMNGWSEQPESSLINSEKFATKALSLNEFLPVAHFVRGLTYREKGEYVKALVEAQKAIDLDPNYANGYVLYATLLYYAGRPEEGLEGMKRAIQLNPHHPYNYPFHLGQAYFVLKRYREAIDAFKHGLMTNPASERLRVWLAAAYAQAGDIDQARWEMEQARIANPDISVANFRKVFPFTDEKDLELFLDGLRKAGLPDSANAKGAG